LSDWLNHVVVNQSFHEKNGPINLALKDEALRLLTNVDYSERSGGDTQYPEINIASLPPEPVERAAIVASAFIYLGSIGWIWRRTSKSSKTTLNSEDRREPASRVRPLDDLEFGLLISVMLLVGPLTSKIYFVALAWPAAAIVGCVLVKRAWRSWRAKALIISIATLNAILPLIPGRATQRLFLVVGADFYINCAMLAGSFAALWLHRGDAAMRSTWMSASSTGDRRTL